MKPHQWISHLLWADAIERPDNNQVGGEDVPGGDDYDDQEDCDEEEEKSPDIFIEDEVLEDEPGNVEDDKKGEGDNTASLDDHNDGDDEADVEDDDDGDVDVKTYEDEDEKDLLAQAAWVYQSSGEVDQAGENINDR